MTLLLALSFACLLFAQQSGTAPTPAPPDKDKPSTESSEREVVLSFVVDAHGLPALIKVVSGAGAGLDQLAVESLSKSRFKPAIANGVPVPVKAQVVIKFNKPNDGPPASPVIVKQFSNGKQIAPSLREMSMLYFDTAIGQLHGDANHSKNEAAAFENMKQSAGLSYPPAEAKLGELYAKGIGSTPDKTKAIQYFERAAHHNDPDGQYWLGVAYRNGDGVKEDSAKALQLFERAAEQDQAGAEFALGLMLETAEGTLQNLTRARDLYQASAEQGIPNAQYHLAKLLWPNDQTGALKWMILAGKGGFPKAGQDLTNYRAASPPEKSIQAEKDAASFAPRPRKLSPVN